MSEQSKAGSGDNAPNLKDTVLTPKTDFPMKADLIKRERETLERWYARDLYGEIRKRANQKRAEGAPLPLFVLHDGPPYANGDAHTGTGMNKILKDMVVKFRTLQGFDAPYIPGWDCHGLPIEHKVLEELGGRKPEDMTALEVRQKCRAFAESFIDRQREQFKRTLTLGRWEKPYLTIDPVYEGGVLDCFADLVERGLITRSLKPVHWSWAAQSALAEAELEYEDRTDPSIYVKFGVEVQGETVSKLLEATGAKYPMLLIWTTTPWTLPANQAVAVSPSAEYGVYQVGEEAWIMAVELAPAIFEKAGNKPREPKLVLKGDELTALTYRHAIWDTPGHRVVTAEYVTLTDGTGLVHTAPGHGQEDFQTGQKYGLPTVCPVDEKGCYYRGEALLEQLGLADSPLTDSAKAWFDLLEGQHILKANKLIIQKLESERQKSGQPLMVHWHEFSHSYPHCWRTHKPVIFRATEQWFVSIDGDIHGRTLRSALLEQVAASEWFPAWGRKRIGGMIENRPDWCISRQRYWGIPIPAFRDPETGRVCAGTSVARRIADVVREHGSDVWYDLENWSAERLLPDEHRPEEFRGKPLERMNDIFDVWFESGASHRGVVAAESELQAGGWVPSPTTEKGAAAGGWVPSPTIAASKQPKTHLGYYKPRHLPHVDVPELAQFITFQLVDATHAVKQENVGPDSVHEEDADLLPEERIRRDKLLDRGAGECILRDARVATTVKEALEHYDGVQYDLLAWTIMPNHVHVLAVMREGASLGQVVKGWKRVSASKINKLLGRSGSVWQDDYFDRYMRNDEHRVQTTEYIANNPVKAGLVDRPEDWPFSFIKGWFGKSSMVGEGTHPPAKPQKVSEGAHRPAFRPADLYLEGDDQHRGWFQVSMILSTATQGVSPFRQCLTSAFVVDEKGQKGSKSKGNIFAIDWGCEQVGADLLRLYFASVDTSSPIPVTLDLVRDKTSGSYRTLRNTIRVLLGNLDGFDPATQSVEYERMLEIDRWALSRLAACVEDMTTSWERYEFHVATRRLVDFCNLELSAFYIDVTKDRMYCHGRDSHVRRSGLTAMHAIVSALIRMLAPVCPHTADEAWSYLPGRSEDEWCVLLFSEGWPVSGRGLLRRDLALEESMEAVLEARESVEQRMDDLRKTGAIKKSVQASVKLPTNDLLATQKPQDLATYLSVSEVELLTAGSDVSIAPSPHPRCDRCWNHWPSVAPRADAAGAALCDRCHGVVRKG